MGLFSIIKGVAGAVAGPVTDYMKVRQQIKAEERRRADEYAEAVHVRKVELVKAGLTADMNWEMEFARQAENSWKDEYTLLVVSVPAVMAFIPGLDKYVTRGFAALATTPAWYQLMFVTLFFATVGIRYWRRTQSDT